ncbi:trans-aconitate 2-methyltransferase [Mucilaginibacter gynuensis]|uniref:Trans-aconitate 2-methyltransferase n=1 Tax=Mucilaginibacter gynuensis TaxID=1302236 RepID=A0ABP8FPI1_9SPHI
MTSSSKIDTWSATQYTKFEAERNRPIYDLLNRIPNTTIKTAADIGCGPGNSTALLKAKYPDADVTGIDSSADMIAAARKRFPDVNFEIADINHSETNDRFYVILANASLQWVPDHDLLFPSLLNKLTPGGSLAVQMPDNFDEPAHRLMREVAASGPWVEKLTDATNRIARQSPQWYYELLHSQVSNIDIWRTTYFHLLEGGAHSIVEWFKGTGLRPYLDALDKTEQKGFLADYESAVADAYPQLKSGAVLLHFHAYSL